ncbi:hypothetical protein [Virgibacillus pantothenticus]|uniref:hypothetical protein n=2 Tax=Virgibacillus pantothenticus TaxID=1473 RepID=UPI001B38FBE2|nr:hypothetical protein [Virgibacillus pantothenticus]QTY16925.1 hypothetical protein KBP50_03105 [Virgibacillus pantothenticus]
MMQSFEYEDEGGRTLCKQHHKIRCSECFYVDVLERENQRYKQALEDIRDISTGSPHKFAVKALEDEE